MAWANALIVVPEAKSHCEAGERVEVISYQEF
jgi:molybdopterin biosynthesis enzyme